MSGAVAAVSLDLSGGSKLVRESYGGAKVEALEMREGRRAKTEAKRAKNTGRFRRRRKGEQEEPTS